MSEQPKQPSRPTPAGEEARPRHRHRWLRVITSGLVTLAFSWLIIFFIPHVIDTVRAYNFHAPSQITAISERLKLTPRGTDIFYASLPQIDSKTDFNTHCQTQERTTAILGCFYKDRIYLYDLKNSDLDGMLAVTAAHEMLHAAYQRLTMIERWWLDQRIVAAYDKVKDDVTIKQLMAYYHEAEPGAEIDELHSILGTVIAPLDTELEGYYKRYFQDRAAVVALNEKYNHVFDHIRAQSEALEAKLAAAEPEIAQALEVYDADRVRLEADIANFNARAKSRGFSSQEQFNTERAVLLSRVEALNARRDEINAKVAKYNADVAELNKLSVRTSALYQSMNGAEAAGALQY